VITLPRVRRYSLLIMLFMTCETQLPKLAKEAAKRSNLPYDRKPSASQIPDMADDFLKRVAQKSIHPDRWNRFNELRHVRNAIVHGGGYPEAAQDPKCAPAVKAIATRDEGLVLIPGNLELPNLDPDDYGRIHLEARFCARAIREMIELFEELFETFGCFGSDEVTIEPG
jgi:hypothetical protein